MSWRRSGFIGLIFTVVFLQSSFAQEPVYLDDRSTPKTLIASYFNALNRQEFVRAWGYWDDQIAGTNFEDYVEGFSSVIASEFKMGTPVSEGAAGSIFTKIPLVVMSVDEDGWKEVYQGCFLTRIATPNIQSPPYLGLHFWQGYLTPIEESFKDTPLGNCAELPN